jgi:hypothetical protein
MSECNGVQGYRGMIVVSQATIRRSLYGSEHRIIFCEDSGENSGGSGTTNICKAEWAIDRLWATHLVVFGDLVSCELKSLVVRAESAGLEVIWLQTARQLMKTLK